MCKHLFRTALGVVGIFGALSVGVVNASNTDCWNTYGTPPTTTYASGIVYGCDGEIPIITIYGENGKGITIKAMNEGATKISYANEDIDSYGSLYQRGNNYGFPNVEDIITPIDSGDVAVSAEGYNPGSYSSDIFIKQAKWDASDNRNLWGGSGDEKNLNGFWGYDNINFVITNSGDRQAMCPDGYHISSLGEWNALLHLRGKNYDKKQGTSLFNSWSLYSLNEKTYLNGVGTRFSEDMQIPFAGWRNYEDGVPHTGDFVHYWSSSPYDDNDKARDFYFDVNYLGANNTKYRGLLFPVRCFKDEYIPYSVVPTIYAVTFLDDGVEIASGIVTDGDTRNETVPTPSEKEGYEFNYRYADGTPDTEFNFDAPITSDTLLHAKWTLTGDIPNGIYTGLNGGDKTVIYKSGTYDIKLTIAGENLPETYNWGAMSPLDSYSTDDNAWGGGDDRGGDSGNERYKRQGPCGEGYHVPSAQEWSDLVIAWCSLDEDCSFDEDSYFDLEFLYDEDEIGWGTKFKSVFNIANSEYYFWSSSPIFTSEHDQAYVATIEEYSIIPAKEDNRGNDYGSIKTRCFKNFLSMPSQTYTVSFLDDGVEVASGSVEDGDTRSDTVPTPDEREGYEFEYRYADGTDTEFNFSTPITADTVLHAKWTLTANVPNGIYTGLSGGDITVIWNDATWGEINLTLAGENLPGGYYRGRDTPADGNRDTNRTDSVEHDNDWGGGTDIKENGFTPNPINFEERQGPCQTGYHVPSRGERNSLVIARCNNSDDCTDTDLVNSPDATAGNNLMYINKSGIGTIFMSTFNLSDYQWSSSPCSGNTTFPWINAWIFRLYDDYVYPDRYYYRDNILPVRCFKNYITVSPINYTITFLDDGVEIASGRLEDGDTRSDTIPTPDEREGYEFEYRYADGTDTEFDFSTPITADTVLHAKWTLTAEIPNGIYTLDDGDITVIWNDATWGEINLTLAGESLPGGYYRGRNEPANNNWATNPTTGELHNNDWGGSGDMRDNGFDDGNERYKRQGPCPDGYHVPSRGERNALTIAWCNIYTGCNASTDLQHTSDWTASNKMIYISKGGSGLGSKFRNTFKLGSSSQLWSSSPTPGNFEKAQYLELGSNFVDPKNDDERNDDYNHLVRCMKNYVTPPQIFTLTFATSENNGDTTQIAIEQGSGSVIELSTGAYIATKDEYNHIGWNTNPSATGILETITLTGNVTVYAIFSKVLTVTYAIGTGVSEISQNSGTCTLYNTGASCTVVSPTVTLNEGYSTGVWSNGTDTVNPGENITLTGNDTYTATATAQKYKITYNLDGGNVAGNNPTEYTIESGFTLINPTKNDYVFVGWTGTNLSGLEFAVSISVGTTGNLNYTANWEEDFNHNGEPDSTETKKVVEFLPGEHGTLGGTTRYEILSGLTLASAGYVEPTKTANSGYMFSGWNTAIDSSSPITADITYTAIRGEDTNGNGINDAEETKYKVTVNYEYSRGGEASPSVSGMYLSGIAFNFVSPNIQYYTANSGTISGTGIEQDQSFTVIYKPITDKNQNGIADEIDGYKPSNPSGGGSGGGGGSSNKSDEEKEKAPVDSPEETSQNNNNSAETNTEGQDSKQTSPANSQQGQQYSDEFQQAYEYAYKNGITTMPTIQRANMDGKLTRIAMAKMLSQYAINILGKTPDTAQKIEFNDVTAEQDSEYNHGVTLAYQLGIMGRNMPNNNFRPSDEVTRAEFVTALSRMLYNTSDGEYQSTPKYYVNHMEKLMKEGIITKDNPTMKELRGYVMIMLMRSRK